MSEDTQNSEQTISTKIARLAEECGWNQEEFARKAGLNRQTIRQILQEGDRSLRNSTISSCAQALGLAVNDLRTLPLDRLITRIRQPKPDADENRPKSLLEQATQPELIAWIDRNTDRATEMSQEEMEELLSHQRDSGGPLANPGVEHFVIAIERKRRVIEQIHTIFGTEYIDLVESFIQLVYEKVAPYEDRR